MGKRKAYAVKEKLYLVQRIRDGESQASISRETGVPESTLRGWLKDQEKLKKFAIETQDIGGLKRKRTTTASDTSLLFIHIDLNWSHARSCLLLTDIYADASTSPS